MQNQNIYWFRLDHHGKEYGKYRSHDLRQPDTNTDVPVEEVNQFLDEVVQPIRNFHQGQFFRRHPWACWLLILPPVFIIFMFYFACCDQTIQNRRKAFEESRKIFDEKKVVFEERGYIFTTTHNFPYDIVLTVKSDQTDDKTPGFSEPVHHHNLYIANSETNQGQFQFANYDNAV